MQPFFLHEDGDLSHYLDVATAISYPDVEQPRLPDAEQTERPLSTQNPQEREHWELTLEEVMSIALQNSQVIRSIAQFRGGRQVGQPTALQPEDLTQQRPEVTASTIYDPALTETNVRGGQTFGRPGVEAALAAFDAQLDTSFTWDRTDRPQNVNAGTGAQVFARLLQRDNINYRSELSKRSASGSQWFLRNVTTYDSSNRPLRELTSEWFTSFEAEVRHPLWRGSGVQVNRIPIILARLETDITLSEFEQQVRDFVMEVESAYWDLYFSYHNLDAAFTGFSSAHATWRKVHALFTVGDEEAANESQARGQYYAFRSRLEQAQSDLFSAESRLRYLMGISLADGRLIQPIHEPTKARVEFDWEDIKNEALVRRPEVRRHKWIIKGRQLELIEARNQLLPQFDAVALYRVLGLGDDLMRLGSRFGPNFPERESLAWEDLTEGRYQEWQLGFQFQMPLGFRRELVSVRNRQIRLKRDEKLLEEIELQITHQLGASVRALRDQYQIAQTSYNTMVAYRDQVEATRTAYEVAGTVPLDLLLEAQRNLAQAEVDYFRAITQYNQAIAEVHHRKGSLLEYNGIMLAEGPWPSKAYFDAQTRARQRDASHYLNYGFTRPGVVSRGPLSAFQGDSIPAGDSISAGDSDVFDGTASDGVIGESGAPTSNMPEIVEAPPPVQGDPIYGDLGL